MTIKNAEARVCQHFHLPLQSGSDDILKKMERHYSIEDYLKLVKKTRKMMPFFSFTTDIIVGFPGESEGDFQETLDVANTVSFSKIHVFPYSKRQGTPAATMPNQVVDELKSMRAKELRDLSDELKRREFLRRVGRVEFIVTENDFRATTDSYFTIKSDKFKSSGELIKVKLTKDMFFE